MRIVWDETKSRMNLAKHNVSFALACLVFDDPFHLSVQDRFKEGEERWQTVGRVGDTLLILVAHTYQDKDGEETVRLISARRATKQEQRRYEQGS